MDRRVALSGVLGLHLLAAVAHGTTHGFVPVWLTVEQNVVVALTTFVGPVAGVALDRRGHPLGLPLFTLSMAGALLVGGGLHFVVENPDHVGAIPAGPWRVPFQLSAGGVGLTAALGAVIGGGYWFGRRDGHDGSAPREPVGGPGER